MTERRRSSGDRRRALSGNYYRSGAGRTPASSPFRESAKRTGRLNDLITRTMDISLLALVVIALVYSLLLSSNPVIQASSTAYNSTQNYHDSARRFLKEFKNRNKVTFDEKSVVDGLMQDYPEIDSASVELPVFSERPVVHIHVSPPSFVLSANGQNYLIDAAGKSIGFAANFKVSSKLPKIADQTSYSLTGGKVVLGAPEVAFVESLLAQSARSGISFNTLILPPKAEELDAYPKAEPYFVKFNLAGDAATQIGQFLAAKHSFDASGQQPSTYLDVRVSGKVFYK